MTYSVKMSDISKKFGEIKALDNAKFELKKGEIHAILGENGAGKSTLMNVLSGIYSADSGVIEINEKIVNIDSPKKSIELGVGMIHQHFRLAQSMSVTENIVAGMKNSFFIDNKKISNEITEISKKHKLDIDVNSFIRDLSVAKKQRVEILKLLYRGADILILDEPTTVLTPQESTQLFEILKSMSSHGKSIIIITHKMNEVMNVSDRVTVMRKGKFISTNLTSEVNPQILTNEMVGREIELVLNCPEYKEEKSLLLEAKNINIREDKSRENIHDISFKLHSGEILGVAGISGSGQKTLCETICGLIKVRSGELNFKGKSLVGMDPQQIIKMGISLSFVPEDRLGMGLVSSMDITNNILLKDYHKQSGFMISRKNSKNMAQKLVDKLNIDTPSVSHPVRLLSGGNIQKVLLGREIENDPQLIVTAYPTRGLDIASSHLVYDLMNAQKLKGVGILFVSEDLDDLMGISDRIMVVSNGRISGFLNNRNEFSRSSIGKLMTMSE